MKNMTITAHTGAFNTEDNSIDSVKVSIEKQVEILEIDVRVRPNGTVIIAHDDVKNNDDGVEIEKVFELIKPTNIKINLDLKDTKALKSMHKIINSFDMADRVFFTGVNEEHADIVKNDCPNIDYYINCKPSKILINSKKYQKKLLDMLKNKSALGVNCNFNFASPKLAEILHSNGYLLSLWTVDNQKAFDKTIKCSPDNITTHNPEFIENLIK